MAVTLPPMPEFAPVPPPPEPPDSIKTYPPEDPNTLSSLANSHQDSFAVKDDRPKIPTIDLTTPADDLWQRMRNGFAMPDLDSPLVADRQAWYLNRPDLLQRIFERSRLYLHHIVAELEKRGMPTELALLPVVESSFNPLAYSSARALGMWQFIPSTGKSYNLKQNWWFDQRRDIVASTNAALDYLQYIYEMHGDWHLALASYNWGENAVARGIAKNAAQGLPTDYQSLSMPDETRYYVPKLQAIKNIIAQPELFGIHLDPIPNRPYFGTVERNEKMDVALAARFAEIPVAEFIALNPAYSRPVMPSESNSPLVLPTEKIQIYLDNLQEHEAQDKPLSAWLTHKLKRGESLTTVAKRHGISTTRLKQLNGITQRTRVRPGFALLVPGKDAIAADTIGARLPQTPSKPPRASKKKKHKASKSRSPRKSVVNKRVAHPKGKPAVKKK
ncbi:MAG: transglycosylase SLT domain-containing protein [Sulfuritalea sp.]|nr:transglycosylase SLT domain-containing protein [Sulfuritalea sp.]